MNCDLLPPNDMNLTGIKKNLSVLRSKDDRKLADSVWFKIREIRVLIDDQVRRTVLDGIYRLIK